MALTATDCAELRGLSVRSVNSIYQLIRSRLAQRCEQVSPLGGELEAVESYFRPRLIRGLRGCGASQKMVVFGLFKRGSNVYTEIVPNASKAILQAILRDKADVASVIHTDPWRGYDGMVDVGFDKHFRVNHGQSEFARGNAHVTGSRLLELCQAHTVQFNGVPRRTFYLCLKKTASCLITARPISTKLSYPSLEAVLWLSGII